MADWLKVGPPDQLTWIDFEYQDGYQVPVIRDGAELTAARTEFLAEYIRSRLEGKSVSVPDQE